MSAKGSRGPAIPTIIFYQRINTPRCPAECTTYRCGARWCTVVVADLRAWPPRICHFWSTDPGGALGAHQADVRPVAAGYTLKRGTAMRVYSTSGVRYGS